MKKLILAGCIIIIIGTIFIATKNIVVKTSSNGEANLTITNEAGKIISQQKVRLINNRLQKSKFYEARNIEQCVKESECLWNAFSKFTTIYSDCMDCVIHRWEQPIMIKIIGSHEDMHVNAVKEFIDKAQPNMSVPITFSEDPNFLIVFSDNIKHDVYGKHREYLSGFYDWELFEEEFKNSKLMSQLDIDDHRYMFKAAPFYSENQSFEKYVVFIDVDEDSWKRYLDMRLFTGLGFTSNSYSMTGLEDYDSKTVNKLKQKLISILYGENIKSGKSIGEVKEIFTEYQSLGTSK